MECCLKMPPLLWIIKWFEHHSKLSEDQTFFPEFSHCYSSSATEPQQLRTAGLGLLLISRLAMGGLDLPGSNEDRHIKDLPRIIVITGITKIIMVVTHHKKGIYHTIEEMSSPRNTCNGYRYILLVDCPTQLICFWIFVCSMTKLKEHTAITFCVCTWSRFHNSYWEILVAKM